MGEPAAAPQPRILVVDDEMYNRDLMLRTFARSGEVVAAADAGEAARVLERWEADVLVTDFLLGGVDGVELARRVRARWPAMRIVVVTGFEHDPALLAAQEAGIIDDIVPKPWAPSGLRARVLRGLGR